MTDPNLVNPAELNRGSEQKQAKAVGELALHNVFPIKEWSHPQAGLEKHIPGVYLGVKVGLDGWNDGYVDESETPVPEAGIIFGVVQASYGYTGIFAKALEGYKVESAQFDPSTRQINWIQPQEGSDDVIVTGDWGRMSETPSKEWASANLGNPGGKAGIVRVTNTEGEVKHYALGANFEGEPDSWTVKGALVEVAPHEHESLPSAKPELPPVE